MAEGKVIIVNPDMFGKDPDSKTTKANEVAKSFGLSDAALAEVEDFKAQLTKHNAWDLPFMGYVCVLASWRPLCERCFSAV